MANTGQISVYNLADLKNTSDDALVNYLTSLKFTQSTALSDTRLALGYSAVFVSAACFLWDYKFGFESTKYATAAAVVIYTLLNGVSTLWTSMMENNTVYEGTSPAGETINIKTWTQQHVPTYKLTITTTALENSKSGASKAPHSVKNLLHPFRLWFDKDGRFISQPFQEMLASNIPIIGRADPERTRSLSHDIIVPSSEALDALIGGMAAENDKRATSPLTRRKLKGRKS